ncbi:MAG: GntR family transcriptional regulator [bacterium]|nr:GntR family transcriptional regulator [bacterium]
MRFDVNKNASMPIYLQISSYFQEEIAAGRLQTGDRVPSQKDLCQKFGISSMTVSQAFKELRKLGLIEQAPGKGTFISGDSSVKNALPVHTTAIKPITKTIGLLILSVTYFFPEIIRGVEDEASRNGYSMILCNTDDDGVKERRYIHELVEKVDGFIIAPAAKKRFSDISNYLFLKAREVPVVFIDRNIEELGFDYVIPDNSGGVYKAVSHLIGQGHRRIAYIGNSDGNSYLDAKRLDGYKQALMAHGIDFDPGLTTEIHFDDSWSPTADCETVERLMKSEDRPTAIFVLNDIGAKRVYNALKTLGFKVPWGISMIGYDDTWIARELEVPLTSVAPPKYEIGERAGRILFSRLGGQTGEKSGVIIEPSLIVRESTAPVKVAAGV